MQKKNPDINRDPGHRIFHYPERRCIGIGEYIKIRDAPCPGLLIFSPLRGYWSKLETYTSKKFSNGTPVGRRSADRAGGGTERG